MLNVLICDKCGRAVSPFDDVAYLEAELSKQDKDMAHHKNKQNIFKSRHIVCSPSRAQFIVHKDFPITVEERPQFDKRKLDKKKCKAIERKYTEAWVRMRMRYQRELEAQQMEAQAEIDAAAMMRNLMGSSGIPGIDP